MEGNQVGTVSRVVAWLLLVMIVSCLLVLPSLAASEVEGAEGVEDIGGADENGGTGNGDGDGSGSDTQSVVYVQSMADEETLSRLDGIVDAAFFCCACVMFSGGSVVGLGVVRIFWHV